MDIPKRNDTGIVEVEAVFNGPMPTGVAVSKKGRIFINYPKWGDDVQFSVVELKSNNTEVPYPNRYTNNYDSNNPKNTWLSVQSVYTDHLERLWVLDTGAPFFDTPNKEAAKLVSIDLETDEILDVYTFSESVLLDTTYLNDMRFDWKRGKKGTAFITDSSVNGPGAIIILDLESGKSRRVLDGVYSTAVDESIIPKVEGKPLQNVSKSGCVTKFHVAVDGIELSPDKKNLYFCPLVGRYLYSIETKLLFLNFTDTELENKVKKVVEKGSSDGLIMANDGTLYAGDYENNSIVSIDSNGTLKTVVQNDLILWPDSMSIGKDGYLYVTVNQVHRQPNFNRGIDMRNKPYLLLKIKIDKEPSN